MLQIFLKDFSQVHGFFVFSISGATELKLLSEWNQWISFWGESARSVLN